MALSAKRDPENIRFSIQKHVKDAFVTPNSLGSNFNFNDATFDESGLDYWVSLSFLENMAGAKGFTMVQLEISSRTGGRLSGGTGDRYKKVPDDLHSKLQDAMEVDSIQIYDYAVPASPTPISNARLVVKNSDGTFRAPEEVRTFEEDEDGVARRILTYMLWALGDLSGADRYYD